MIFASKEFWYKFNNHPTLWKNTLVHIPSETKVEVVETER